MRVGGWSVLVVAAVVSACEANVGGIGGVDGGAAGGVSGAGGGEAGGGSTAMGGGVAMGGGASAGGSTAMGGGASGGSASGGGTAVDAGTVSLFVAIGHVTRSIVSCDDGRTWVANRSDNDEIRCFTSAPDGGSADCDHRYGAGRGIA